MDQETRIKHLKKKHETLKMKLACYLIWISLIFSYSVCFSQDDPRENNHATVILKFKQQKKIKYYITWSSSAEDAWEHDIYREIIHFNNRELIIDSDPQRYIGSGHDEAQEPVSAAITPENIILSAWEDGSGTSIDIRGQLHKPDGTIIKSNWIIAGGTESQHSPAVCHIGDKFLVAYTDEAPPAEHAMNKVKVLDEHDGTEQKLFEVKNQGFPYCILINIFLYLKLALLSVCPKMSIF